MQRLGHTLLVGDAAKIRAMVVRKTKTDRRDALHLLDLLRHDRFPPSGCRTPPPKPGGRLIRHARYFVLPLAESYLTSTLFRQILGRIARLGGIRRDRADGSGGELDRRRRGCL